MIIHNLEKVKGDKWRNFFLRDYNFWQSMLSALKTSKSLVEVLRLVDGEKSHEMDFIYNALDKTKVQIAENLGR